MKTLIAATILSLMSTFAMAAQPPKTNVLVAQDGADHLQNWHQQVHDQCADGKNEANS